MLWFMDAQHHHKLFSSSVNADKPDMPDCCYAEPSGKGKGQRHLAGDWTNHLSITVKLLPEPVKRREKPPVHLQRNTVRFAPERRWRALYRFIIMSPINSNGLWTASESHNCSSLIPELLMEVWSSEHTDRMWNSVQINILGHRVPFTSSHNTLVSLLCRSSGV